MAKRKTLSMRTDLMKWFWYPLLLLFGFAFHGLLLLNDGVYWDGWLIYMDLVRGDWISIREAFFQSGLPQLAYVHWTLGSLPSFVFGYKCVAFLALITIALFTFAISDRLGVLSRSESFAVAALAMVYPAFQVGIELIVIPYLLSLALFFAATFVALLSESKNGKSHWILRLVALMLFLASFTTGSLLILYFGFLILLLASSIRWNTGWTRRWTVSWIVKHLDYMMLPFLYWSLIRMAFPTYGRYAEYNSIGISPYRLFRTTIGFLENALLGQIYAAGLLAVQYWGIGLLCMACVVGIMYLPRSATNRMLHGRSWSPVLLMGLVLLALSILPYAVVGKAPSLHGWKTRHALLISLPVALLAVGASKVLAVRYGEYGRRVGLSLLSIAIVVFSFATVMNYFSWQARWAKDRSVMAHLKESGTAQEFSVYLIDDRFPAGGEDSYRYYEWSSMFDLVWGESSRLGLPLSDAPMSLAGTEDSYNEDWSLASFNPDGERAVLEIRRANPLLSNERLALRYLWYKHVIPTDLDSFLLGVSDVDVYPVGSHYQHAKGSAQD